MRCLFGLRCKIVYALVVTGIFACAALSAQQPNQIVPIPGEQLYSEQHPVDAIVTDSQGNIHEETYTYYPNYYPDDPNYPDRNVVIINNTQQYVQDGGYYQTSPSLFFPGFALGFIFADGYWCNYNGYYWNGYGYFGGHSRYWHNHWNNYWNRDWNNRWHNHWNQHHNNQHWRYRNNERWNDHRGRSSRSGQQSRSRGGGHGGRGGGHGGGHGGHGGGHR